MAISRAHLIKKTIRDKLGRARSVWVKPDEYEEPGHKHPMFASLFSFLRSKRHSITQQALGGMFPKFDVMKFMDKRKAAKALLEHIHAQYQAQQQAKEKKKEAEPKKSVAKKKRFSYTVGKKRKAADKAMMKDLVSHLMSMADLSDSEKKKYSAMIEDKKEDKPRVSTQAEKRKEGTTRGRVAAPTMSQPAMREAIEGIRRQRISPAAEEARSLPKDRQEFEKKLNAAQSIPGAIDDSEAHKKRLNAYEEAKRYAQEKGLERQVKMTQMLIEKTKHQYEELKPEPRVSGQEVKVKKDINSSIKEQIEARSEKLIEGQYPERKEIVDTVYQSAKKLYKEANEFKKQGKYDEALEQLDILENVRVGAGVTEKRGVFSYADDLRAQINKFQKDKKKKEKIKTPKTLPKDDAEKLLEHLKVNKNIYGKYWNKDDIHRIYLKKDYKDAGYMERSKTGDWQYKKGRGVVSLKDEVKDAITSLREGLFENIKKLTPEEHNNAVDFDKISRSLSNNLKSYKLSEWKPKGYGRRIYVKDRKNKDMGYYEVQPNKEWVFKKTHTISRGTELDLGNAMQQAIGHTKGLSYDVNEHLRMTKEREKAIKEAQERNEKAPTIDIMHSAIEKYLNTGLKAKIWHPRKGDFSRVYITHSDGRTLGYVSRDNSGFFKFVSVEGGTKDDELSIAHAMQQIAGHSDGLSYAKKDYDDYKNRQEKEKERIKQNKKLESEKKEKKEKEELAKLVREGKKRITSKKHLGNVNDVVRYEGNIYKIANKKSTSFYMNNDGMTVVGTPKSYQDFMAVWSEHDYELHPPSIEEKRIFEANEILDADKKDAQNYLNSLGNKFVEEGVYPSTDKILELPKGTEVIIKKVNNSAYEKLIISSDKIWHLRYNGLDGDNWSYNNVVGAWIGRYIPYDNNMAAKIKNADAIIKKPMEKF